MKDELIEMDQPELFVIAGPNAAGKSSFIMTLKGLEIALYKENEHQFIQAFGKYAFSKDRLSKEALDIIVGNKDYRKEEPL